jgi:DNA polymerase-1
MRYRELEATPVDQWPKAARDYAISDVQHTAELWLKIRDLPQYVSWDATQSFQARAAWGLHLSSAWGLRTDRLAVRELQNALDVKVQACNAVLREHGVLRRDGTREQKQVEAFVWADYAQRGEQPPKTPTGRPKCDTDALKSCTHPALVALRDSSASRTLLGTFVPVLESGTKLPINPGYTVIRESGRTSAHNPNIQNLPRDGGVRECFVAREGYLYACADFHVAELVCLAQVLLKLFGESAMADALRSGKDLHLTTASMILERGYEDTVKAYSEGDKAAKSARQLAKALNFGVPGGMAAPKLRDYMEGYGIKMSEAEAGGLRNRWLALYPEMGRYFRHLKGLSRMGEFTAVHPLTGFVRGGVEYTSGANHFFQHLCSQVAKQAIWEVSLECYTVPTSPLFGSRIVAFIHDELLLESPEAVAPEAADRLAKVMQSAAAYWLPDLELHADAHLMRRWFKSAGPVRDASGRLLPWQPKSE